MELAPNDILRDRYRITQALGKGGMGAVYLAYDTSLEQKVAIKSNHSPSAESAEQFLKEAQLLANLRHPSLPRVIDYFLLEETQFLVMDYIPGEDLSQILKKESMQPIEKVLKWAEELGSALAYMHSQDPPVIHRDIKPANIKLTEEGEAILVDFGIAKAADASQATAAGAMGYTPGYAPPEQYGRARTGPFSDQYALAATLYDLLTDLTPVDSVQRALEKAVLTPMNLLNPEIPEHVQGAIERAMSVRHQDRFADIREFIQALTDPAYQPTVQIERPMPAAAPEPAKPTQPTKKKQTWIWLAVGAAAVLALILGISGAGFLALRNNKQPTATTAPTIAVVEIPTESPVPTALPTNTPLPEATETPLPTNTAEPTATPAPNYLAEGKQVAFASNRGDGETFQIWRMKIILGETGALSAADFEQLTDDPGDKLQPAWSPDGTKILYASSGPDPENTGDFGTEIFMLDLSTEEAQPVNLSQQRGDDNLPIWSPDGKLIAFVNRSIYTEVEQIYVMNADGSNKRRISGDYVEYNPDWSPDMKWLLNIIVAGGHQYFHIRDWVEEPYPTPLPTSKPFDRQAYFGRQGEVADFAWSPNGSQIAYTRVDGYIRQIYAMEFSSRGEKTTLLTSDTFANYEPAWSPDSQWIVYTSEQDGNPELYIMTGTGLLQTNLTGDPASDMQPAWQP